jgi:RNA polymerase sigma-70 factor (ECF subfamily)
MPDTEELLQRVADGDQAAVDEVLSRHRNRLKRMISARLDARISARIDPSDIVQETLLAASRMLDDYLRGRPVPFYPWLRQLAWDKLVEQHRRHVDAQVRTVKRERAMVSDESANGIADRLFAHGAAPSARIGQAELRLVVRRALAELPEADREVLIMRFIEQHSTKEVAAILGLQPRTIQVRQLKAMQRLRARLREYLEDS